MFWNELLKKVDSKQKKHCLTVLGTKREQKNFFEPRKITKTFVVKKYMTNGGFSDYEISICQKREQAIKASLRFAISDNF